MIGMELQGWDRLRHGGLLLDPPRLSELAGTIPDPLSSYDETELRRRATALLAGDGNASEFIAFVLDRICGFTEANGAWKRGNSIGTEWSRVTVTGEHFKPRQLWRGRSGGDSDGILPVFMDNETRIGIGRGRKATSQVLQWLRAGTERLALLTNGRQWRLCFAGLDFDAWCEWDLDLWFEEGQLSPQVLALRSLLQPRLWTPAAPNTPCPLLQAILDSRKGQAELSQVLGERVRESVEILVQGHGEILKERCANVDPAVIYRAAVRMVMRLVVVLFAESRDLLPRDNTFYHGAYGLRGLLEDLEKTSARGGNRLARSWNAWPRILALFRLVYHGSHHPSLGIPAYGGELFAPGDAASNDGLIRAVAVFETGCFEHEMISDRDIHRMLERITRTKVKVRQGRGSTSIPVPVDFSDLSSEYIGILYEGLLDFELRTAPSGDPVIFLAIGDQPALPLSRLEGMDDAALASLLEKMKQTRKDDSEEEEETQEEESAEESATPVIDDSIEEEPEPEEEVVAGDARHTTRTRAETWARRAVIAGKLVPKPRGNLTPEKKLQLETMTGKIASQLVSKVVLPGEWYLVRWGGTRKGSGTFYTRPGLAVPTVHRTLRPLAWDPPVDPLGQANRDALPSQWSPKRPEEILSLKVVDPACGSGTFPVAVLRFLTESLFASLHHHGRIQADGDRAVVALLQSAKAPDGRDERLCEELMPCRPDEVSFEPRLKAVLRRHVVERCVYGVDMDPLAVELCRLALWIETMDRTLPFSFLDHKVKCGNALVGTWFDQFQHYPAMAWKNRESGDKNHTNGVHFKKEERTKAVKAFVESKLKPDLRHFFEGLRFGDLDPQNKAASVHAKALATFSRLHDLPVQDSAERARIYREELLNSSEYQTLKEALDLWCACWFWPADQLDKAPLPTTISEPTKPTRDLAALITFSNRFFHWELEFPDVYRTKGGGFDAVLGNPPWDIAKPSSKEFFSNIDPLYRSYGKQQAINFQTDYFRERSVEVDWLEYNASFRANAHFIKYSSRAYGDPSLVKESADRFSIARGNANDEIHLRWRKARERSFGFSDSAHPFRHQGSADINLYKLFLEQAHAILTKGGRLGFVLPSGLYSDHGSEGLRRLLLDGCSWEWLFNFINWDRIFPSIYYRLKFNVCIAEKAGRTSILRTAFLRTELEDWEQAELHATEYLREQVDQFSPRSKAILEVQSARDLEILEKVFSSSILLGDEGENGWGVKYVREFDMTNDSKLFQVRPRWEADGYRADEYSRWLKGAWRPIEALLARLGPIQA